MMKFDLELTNNTIINIEIKSSNKLHGSTTSCTFERGSEANLTSSAFLMQVLGVRVY